MTRLRSAASLLVLAAALSTTACRCQSGRSVDFTGRLGDSTTAAGFTIAANGGIEMWFSEYLGEAYDTRYMDAQVNVATFADSVLWFRLFDFSDATRTPLMTFNKAKGRHTGSVFHLNISIDSANFRRTYEVFEAGDGVIEIEPHMGQKVRARIKVLNRTPMHDICT
jgi:hypothetical protein